MKTRAAVAWEAGKPLEIEELELDGPKEGEVLIKIVATGVCHTDAFTLSGEDPEGIFPSVLGHEGAGIVMEVGKNVTSVKPELSVNVWSITPSRSVSQPSVIESPSGSTTTW